MYVDRNVPIHPTPSLPLGVRMLNLENGINDLICKQKEDLELLAAKIPIFCKWLWKQSRESLRDLWEVCTMHTWVETSVWGNRGPLSNFRHYVNTPAWCIPESRGDPYNVPKYLTEIYTK